jgi:hypothetical protein
LQERAARKDGDEAAAVGAAEEERQAPMVRVGMHALSSGELRETLFQARDATVEVRAV